MALVLSNATKVTALEMLTNNTSGEDLILRLFQNDHEPAGADIVGNYVEADFSGYSEIALVPGDWSISSGPAAIALYNASQTFVSDADSQAQDIYGYYIVGDTSGDLKWAERFVDGPYHVNQIGDTVGVIPRISATGIGE